MSKFFHGLLLSLYTLIVLAAIVWLGYMGYAYYRLPVEGIARVDHPLYGLLRPNGFIGHGLGIVGTLLIVIGLFAYMARKRIKIFSRWGILKYWLEAHIFLCSLGFVMVTFHTSFKFGGLISIGYWSLTVVFLSGMVGRFLYIQIPRSIEGRELSIKEIIELKNKLDDELNEKYGIRVSELKKVKLSEVKQDLISNNVSRREFNKIRRLLRRERILRWRIKRLDRIRELFKHWHVIHLPFALIMLIIMVIHVGVALYFGYSWIFFK
jgi:hypothetical protein